MRELHYILAFFVIASILSHETLTKIYIQAMFISTTPVSGTGSDVFYKLHMDDTREHPIKGFLWRLAAFVMRAHFVNVFLQNTLSWLLARNGNLLFSTHLTTKF